MATPSDFFPHQLLKKKYLQKRAVDGKPLNPNATWREATYMIYRNLNMGMNPQVMNKIFICSQLDGNDDEYQKAYLADCRRALDNMVTSGYFDFPAMVKLHEYNEIASDEEKLCFYEMASHFWFCDREHMLLCMLDDGKEEELAKDEFELDTEDLVTLERLELRFKEDIDEHYRDNEDFLTGRFGWTVEQFKKHHIPTSKVFCAPLPETTELHLFTPVPKLRPKGLLNNLPYTMRDSGAPLVQVAGSSYPCGTDLYRTEIASGDWELPTLPYRLRMGRDMPENKENGRSASPEYLGDNFGVAQVEKLTARSRRILEQRRRARHSASPTPRSRSLANHSTPLAQFQMEYEVYEEMGCPLYRM